MAERKKKIIKSAGTDKKGKSTESVAGKSIESNSEEGLIWGRRTFIYIGAGLILIALGFILMMGGNSGDPNVFDPDKIYSFRRITLAPLLVIAGLILPIIAIFKGK